jgi:hypothetical protein
MPFGAYRKLADSKPLTLQGSDYAKAVEEAERGCWTGGRVALAVTSQANRRANPLGLILWNEEERE